MTTVKIARDYLAKIEARLDALQLFLDRGRFDDVMREAQEIIEPLVKGALRFIGVDPPRRHDSSTVLLEHLDRLPAEWRMHAEELGTLSARLFEERGHAFYGDEDDLVPPSEMFDREEAETTIAAVARFAEMYRRLVSVTPR